MGIQVKWEGLPDELDYTWKSAEQLNEDVVNFLQELTMALPNGGPARQLLLEKTQENGQVMAQCNTILAVLFVNYTVGQKSMTIVHWTVYVYAISVVSRMHLSACPSRSSRQISPI